MGEEYKRCPDCAEQVLAAARKCRYCGYRFDRRVVASAGNSLLDLVLRPKSTTTLPELLHDWGSELAQDERVTYFGYCRLDSRDGFLLITTTRVSFFAGRGENRLLEWPLDQVSASRAGRRTLRLAGPHRDATLTRPESGSALAAIARALGG